MRYSRAKLGTRISRGFYIFDIFQISCCSSNDFDHPDTSPPRGLPQNERQPLLQNPPHHLRRKRRDRQPHQILHSTETAKEEAQSHVSSLQHSQLDSQVLTRAFRL